MIRVPPSFFRNPDNCPFIRTFPNLAELFGFSVAQHPPSRLSGNHGTCAASAPLVPILCSFKGRNFRHRSRKTPRFGSKPPHVHLPTPPPSPSPCSFQDDVPLQLVRQAKEVPHTTISDLPERAGLAPPPVPTTVSAAFARRILPQP